MLKIAIIVAVIGSSIWVWEEVVEDRISPKRSGVVVPGEVYRSGQLSPALVRKTLDHDPDQGRGVLGLGHRRRRELGGVRGLSRRAQLLNRLLVTLLLVLTCDEIHREEPDADHDQYQAAPALHEPDFRLGFARRTTNLRMR